MRLTAILFMVLVVGGCAGSATLSRVLTGKTSKRASFDFECPEAQIQVSKLDEKTYAATGCGKRAAYVAIGESCGPGIYFGESGLQKACTVVLDGGSLDEGSSK